MNHAENKNIWSKMKEKLHKYSFLGCLLLAGIVFFTWTDNWQVYTEPLQETYTKGVLLAEQLAQSKKEVTLVTNSAFMASYVKGSSVRVVVLGGDYQPQVQAMVGPLTKLCAQQFQVDKLFVGTDGYSFENGFTGDNLVRSDTVKAMAQSARHTIVLTESEKFTRSGTVSFLKTEQVSGVITDTGRSQSIFGASGVGC